MAASSEGPRIGLASYHGHDPEGTFRLIEPVRQPRLPSPAAALRWPALILLVWVANLGALAFSGIALTTVGAADPVAYAWWPAVFAIANVGFHLTARRWHGRIPPLAAAVVLPLVANVPLTWVMTVLSPPVHGTVLTGVLEVAAIMWLVNVPVALLIARR